MQLSPRSWLAKANVGSFIVGIGDDIFRDMQGSIEAAESELVIINLLLDTLHLFGQACCVVAATVRQNHPKQPTKGPRFIGFSSAIGKFQCYSTLHHFEEKITIHQPAEEARTAFCGGHYRALMSISRAFFVRPFCVMVSGT